MDLKAAQSPKVALGLLRSQTVVVSAASVFWRTDVGMFFWFFLVTGDMGILFLSMSW